MDYITQWQFILLFITNHVKKSILFTYLKKFLEKKIDFGTKIRRFSQYSTFLEKILRGPTPIPQRFFSFPSPHLIFFNSFCKIIGMFYNAFHVHNV